MQKNTTSFNRFIRITHSYYFFSIILIFCVTSFFYFDQPIAFYMKYHANRDLVKAAKTITTLGKGTGYFITLSLIFIITTFVYKNKVLSERSGFLFLCISISALVCNLLKMLLGRTRPNLLFHHDLYQFSFLQTQSNYFSFPSGHSMLITSFMLGLSFLFTRYWLTFLSLAVIISLTRVIVTAHFLSDIVAGMYLAILIVSSIYQWLEKACVKKQIQGLSIFQ